MIDRLQQIEESQDDNHGQDSSLAREQLQEAKTQRSKRERLRQIPKQITREKTVGLLPSLFTLGNSLCGFMAIFLASRPETSELPFNWSPVTYAAIFIFVGMIFDAVDGRIARLTNSTSDLGAQLDSLSDMITFGVAPAFIVVQMAIGQGLPFFSISESQDLIFQRFTIAVAMIYVSCAALRLARFNVEVTDESEEAHRYFKGLPSPAAAGVIASLILLQQELLGSEKENLQTIIATGLVFVMMLVALAMVSSLKYPHPLNQKREKLETIAKIMMVVLLCMIRLKLTLSVGLLLYTLYPIARLIFPAKESELEPEEMAE